MMIRRASSNFHWETGSKALSGGMGILVHPLNASRGIMSIHPEVSDPDASLLIAHAEGMHRKTASTTKHNLIVAPRLISPSKTDSLCFL
jgi:hypothetical protein